MSFAGAADVRHAPSSPKQRRPASRRHRRACRSDVGEIRRMTLIATPPDVPEAHTAPPVRPMVRAVGLGRRFGDQWAVRDLDLELAPGEVFALLGPNGAGKTTTVRMLTA